MEAAPLRSRRVMLKRHRLGGDYVIDGESAVYDCWVYDTEDGLIILHPFDVRGDPIYWYD